MLKFRAWDKKEKKFESYFYITNGGELGIFNNTEAKWERAEDDRYDLMRYTGLRDKKRTKKFPEGQEIYEGDIINDGFLGLVKFGKAAAKIDEWYCWRGWYVEYENLENGNITNTCEIIGNVYESKIFML